MKFVIQRVSQAEVRIEGGKTESIGPGLLILIGIGEADSPDMIDAWIDKILKLRIFADDAKPINRSIQDINGEILLISQFTLYADSKGNRPSFLKAAKPDKAKAIYDDFVARLKARWPQTKTGEFGADMKVHLVNDGPVTILLDSDER